MRIALFLTLAILLAGCISTSPPSGNSDVPAANEAATQALELTECKEILTVVPVDLDEAADLPAGFNYVPFDATETTVQLTVIAAACNDDLDVFFMHPVQPPDAYQDDAAVVQLFLTHMLSLEDNQAWYEAHGITVRALHSNSHDISGAADTFVGRFEASEPQGQIRQEVTTSNPENEAWDHGWLWYEDGTGSLSLLRVDLGPRTVRIGSGVLSTPDIDARTGFGLTMTGSDYVIRLTPLPTPNPHDAL